MQLLLKQVLQNFYCYTTKYHICTFLRNSLLHLREVCTLQIMYYTCNKYEIIIVQLLLVIQY